MEGEGTEKRVNASGGKQKKGKVSGGKGRRMGGKERVRVIDR